MLIGMLVGTLVGMFIVMFRRDCYLSLLHVSPIKETFLRPRKPRARPRPTRLGLALGSGTKRPKKGEHSTSHLQASVQAIPDWKHSQ
eukprot:215603-Prorocentrum_minimum.AAC.2